MGFAIFTVFLLAIGSPFSGQAVSVDLQQPSPSVHHRTSRQEGQETSTSSGTCVETATCVEGFVENNGNCYYFSSDKANWQQASDNCKKLGRDNEMVIKLAELGNPDNLKSDGWLLQQIKAKEHVVWLGADDVQKNGDWRWTHSNRKLSRNDAYWGFSQPNNLAGGQYCLSTFTYKDDANKRHYLNDEKCTEDLHYVCQKF